MIEKKVLVIIGMILIIGLWLLYSILAPQERLAVLCLEKTESKSDHFIEITEENLNTYPTLKELFRELNSTRNNEILHEVKETKGNEIMDYIISRYREKYDRTWGSFYIKYREEFYWIALASE